MRVPDSSDYDEIKVKGTGGDSEMASLVNDALKVTRDRPNRRRVALAAERAQRAAYASELVDEAKQKQVVVQAKAEAARPAEQEADDQLKGVLEQWRQYLLRQGALTEDGLALGLKKVRGVPGVDQLTPEHRSQIRAMQREIYLSGQPVEVEPGPKPKTQEIQNLKPEEPDPEGTYRIVPGHGIYVGQADGDMLFLDPEQKKYLGKDNIERIIDLGFGKRVTATEAMERMISQSERRSLRHEIDDETTELFPANQEAEPELEADEPVLEDIEPTVDTDKTEIIEHKEAEPFDEQAMDDLRQYFLDIGALDKKGTKLSDTSPSGLDIKGSLRPGEAQWILTRQQRLAARERESANTEIITYADRRAVDGSSFEAGGWYPLKVNNQEMALNYRGVDPDSGDLIFLNKAGYDMSRNTSLTQILKDSQDDDKYAFRLRPADAEKALILNEPEEESAEQAAA